MTNPMLSLGLILILGITAQLIAGRLRLPSILLLLIFGFIAGPVTGILDINALLGDLLFPIVSISVGIILAEGGLTLKLSDIRGVRQVIWNLNTIGAFVTWVLASFAAYHFLGFETDLALLIGAILIVTGPTVIGPLLRHVRPSPRVGSILRWEGILIDPVGATAAVLVFQAITMNNLREAIPATLGAIVMVLIVGGTFGYAFAKAVEISFSRYIVPDHLQNAVMLMAVVAAFVISEQVQHEAGLLTTTVMGIVLANQKSMPIRRILEFKETLTILLISALFILLSARLELEDFTNLGVGTLLFILALIFVVRPATVIVSSYRSELTFREKLFLMWMAPRGIVAASVASIFALRLEEMGHPQAHLLVPVIFAVIVATCALYGLTALPVARFLKLSQANPQGVLIVGAHSWAREMGKALQQLGHRVLLVDTNFTNLQVARSIGLQTHYGSAVGEHTHEALDLQGIGRVLSLTSNDEVNTLTDMHYSEIFGRGEVYQLAPKTSHTEKEEGVPRELRGRVLFNADCTFDALNKWFNKGAQIQTTVLTSTFNFEAFEKHHGKNAIPLFYANNNRNWQPITADAPPTPQVGQTLIWMILDPDKKPNELTPDLLEADTQE